MSGRIVGPAGVSQASFGLGAAFQKLVLSFKNLIGSFCCFFQGCCTALSAFLWGVIIALSMRSWVTSPRVTERIGGRGGKSKSKPYAQWEPRQQVKSPPLRKLISTESQKCKKLCLSRGEDTQTKEQYFVKYIANIFKNYQSFGLKCPGFVLLKVVPTQKLLKCFPILSVNPFYSVFMLYSLKHLKVIFIHRLRQGLAISLEINSFPTRNTTLKQEFL